MSTPSSPYLHSTKNSSMNTGVEQLKGIVLLIEDEDLTGTWLTKELQRRGLICKWVKNKEDALKALEAEQFHAVITDVYLKEGKAGLEIVKLVGSMGLPVIVITSRADLAIAKEALNQGACQLLEKPFEVIELIKTLQKAWDEPRGLTGLLERFMELNQLTPKEKEISRFLLKGLSNLEIANVMGNTEKTIKFHLTVIFQKCGVKSRTEFFNAIFPT